MTLSFSSDGWSTGLHDLGELVVVQLLLAWLVPFLKMEKQEGLLA